MKYGFQIPVPHLNDFQGDFDFALAHLVLNDPEYRKFYREQSEKGRYVMLDNSIHELGTPLSLDDILKAAEYINPTVIIPPDWHGDAERTKVAFRAAMDSLPLERIAPVAQGTDLGSLLDCYSYFLNCGVRMICLPYKMGQVRLDTIPRLSTGVINHFLGINYIHEIKEICKAPNAQLDTGKPFRYAQHDRVMGVTEKDPNAPPKLDMYKKCNYPLVLAQLDSLYKTGDREWVLPF